MNKAEIFTAPKKMYSLMLPPVIMEKLKERAKELGMTFGNHITEILAESLNPGIKK